MLTATERVQSSDLTTSPISLCVNFFRLQPNSVHPGGLFRPQQAFAGAEVVTAVERCRVQSA